MAEFKGKYRGVKNAHYAKVLTDDQDGMTFSEWKPFVPLASVSKTKEVDTETIYYDDIPVDTIDSNGTSTIEIETSAIPFDVLAEITGGYYDEEKGVYIEKNSVSDYFAIGYEAGLTKSDKSIFCVFYKGKFSPVNMEHNTKDDSTESNGQTLTYTGVTPQVRWKTLNGDNAPFMVVDGRVDGTMTTDKFFSKVLTPDNYKNVIE